MSDPADQALVERLARTHRLVQFGALHASARCPTCVLDLGVAVLLHGLLERAFPEALNPLLDASARERLDAEHDRMVDDLELLATLQGADPQSPDAGALAQALLDRLRAHVARDERLLYGAPARVRRATARRSR